MPIYEYSCKHCGAKFEVLTTIDKRDDVVCKNCGEKVSRVYNGKCSFGANACGKDGCSSNCAGCAGCHH